MNKKIFFTLCIVLLPLMLLFTGCAGSGTAESMHSVNTTASSETGTLITSESTTFKDSALTQMSTTAKTGSTDTATNKPDVITETTAKTVVNTTTSKPANTVTLIVQCKGAVEYMKANPEKTAGYENIVPQDGIIMQSSIEIQENDTVLDVLKRGLDEKKILIVVQTGSYVYNIGGLAAKAKAFGEESGWIYSVNGIIPPNIGASMYKVKSGDKIEFMYVCKKVIF